MLCDLFDLKGRTALVTGGSRGLGKAMAKGFAEHGADVMICSRNEEELKVAAAEIGKGMEGSVEYRLCDMSRREDTDALAATALERFGTVDILINNAGVNIPQPIDEVKDETWDCLLYTSPSPRDSRVSRMPSSA